MPFTSNISTFGSLSKASSAGRSIWDVPACSTVAPLIHSLVTSALHSSLRLPAGGRLRPPAFISPLNDLCAMLLLSFFPRPQAKIWQSSVCVLFLQGGADFPMIFMPTISTVSASFDDPFSADVIYRFYSHGPQTSVVAPFLCPYLFFLVPVIITRPLRAIRLVLSRECFIHDRKRLPSWVRSSDELFRESVSSCTAHFLDPATYREFHVSGDFAFLFDPSTTAEALPPLLIF